MSIKILRAADKGKSPLTPPYKRGDGGIIVFLLVSILLHLGVLMIAPQTREGKKTLPRLIPVDMIELPQPTAGEQPNPLLPPPFPFAEEKRIAKPLLPANPPSPPFEKGGIKGGFNEGEQKGDFNIGRMGGLEKKTEQEPLIKKESVEDEKALPSEPIVKEGKPLSLYPTREQIAELYKKYEKEVPVGEKDRDIDFGTSEPLYASYFEGLKAKIYHEWEYPDAAARAGVTGKLLVRFVILKDGKLEEVTLTKSSGYPMLDNAAISAIRLAAPFYPFNKNFGSLEKVTVNASFEYVLYPYINRQRR